MMRKYSAAPSSQRGSVLGILVVITTYLLGSSPMANAESLANELHVKESAAIEALVAAETDAWNRGDAKAFAARFTADGSFTNRRSQRLLSGLPVATVLLSGFLRR